MSNSFEQNPETLAKMFDAIVVPKGFFLNGLHGLLALIFKTDDSEIICAEIELLTSTQTQSLITLFERVLPKLNTQKASVLWKFNDPLYASEEIKNLRIDPQSKDILLSEIQIVAPTFPYIEGFFTDDEIDSSEVRDVRENPKDPHQKNKISATDVIAPIIAVSSLYTASRLLST